MSNGARAVGGNFAPPRRRQGTRPLEALEARTLLASVTSTEPVSARLDVTPTTAQVAPLHYPRYGFDAIKLMFDAPVREGTVDVSDVSVIGPRGPLVITSATAQQVDDAIEGPPWGPQPLLPVAIVPGAVYTVQPPGGAWDAADDGTYTLALLAGAIEGADGNPVTAQSLQVEVAIGAGPAPHVEVGGVAVGGATSHTVSVVYDDDVTVLAESIDATDLTVTGPAGALTVLAPTVGTGASDHTRFVGYEVLAPGGSWDASDNGTYTVSVVAGAVSDAVGTPNAAAVSQFTVVIAGPEPDLVVSAVSPGKKGFPQAVIGGEDNGRVFVRVTNQGDAPAVGPVSVALVARDTNPAGIGDTPILTTPARKLSLKPGASRVVRVRFSYPDVPPWTYRIAATVDPGNGVTESDESNNEAVTERALTISPPFADLAAAALGATTPAMISRGGRITAPLTVMNVGNLPVSGVLNVRLYASDRGDFFIDPLHDILIGTVSKKLRLRPSRSKVLRVTVPVDPALPPGLYFLTAEINNPAAIPETGVGANVVLNPAEVTVG